MAIELQPKYGQKKYELGCDEPVIVIQSVDAGGALAARAEAERAEQAVIDAGDASRLTIGSVTTVDADTPAAAEIVGDPGSQQLNLSIPRGHDGGASFSVGVSAPIGGQRVVYVDENGELQYASQDNPMAMNTVFGITTNAAIAGSTVSVMKFGYIEEPSWSLQVGHPVFLGLNGVITQTAPSTGAFSLIVGFPTTPTKLFVSFREPISLA